ncbi:hypothetical protein B9T29_11350 [Acinetobacter sp. ANC 3903]|uniref:hypothetical protein n=1 Tax=Acinetobacter sp. ANC 3903 TaxID=1977883 RepID=UPI000A357475|nr:hypothetical protein [Acinetobacter sp. ANC 3903]OTG60746.1 hypothetical protein B9T29_11350 [Acinetobacter sp. ANC 3903]
MIGHQRDILATLGIDIWIPRNTACQKMPSSSIWRDQAAPEYQTEIVLAKAPAVLPLELKADPGQAIERIEPVKAPVPASAEKVEVVAEVIAERVALQIAAFQLQALSLPHCVIVVDATEMSAEQQQFWHNIQQAVLAEYYELQWPFPLMNFQDGHGAESYVQGFLDAISPDKNIIFLGQCSYFRHSKSINLAGLQEMLDQPLLKKRLWQFMQKRPQKMDGT